uniref:Uncharacterized protein n=1 Tax=Panagrolaimus superbus TaxID=310955 RepID=A0A914ZAS7_9BILA
MAPLMPYFDPTNLSPLTLATIVKRFKLIPDEQLNDYLAEHIVNIYDDGNHNRGNANRGRGFIRDGIHFHGIEGGHPGNYIRGGIGGNPQYARRSRPRNELN